MDFRNAKHIVIGFTVLVSVSVLVAFPDLEDLQPPLVESPESHGTRNKENKEIEQGGSELEAEQPSSQGEGLPQDQAQYISQESGSDGNKNKDGSQDVAQAAPPSGSAAASESLSEKSLPQNGDTVSYHISAQMTGEPSSLPAEGQQLPPAPEDGTTATSQSETPAPPSGEQQHQHVKPPVEGQQQTSDPTLEKPTGPEQPDINPDRPPPATDAASPGAPQEGSTQGAFKEASVESSEGVNKDARQGAAVDVAEVKEEEADGKDTDKDIEPPKEGEKMPSFDEWKQKMLAEQAEHDKTKQMGAQASQLASVKQQSTKNRVNYASMTCGAKVLATNAEAKNAGFILTENKDQYMIQPCQAKKWFVAELCEPVTVRSLEMANLELFSSLPESFIVHTSDRYPSKEWKALGIFNARDERTIQNFQVSDEEMFAKYIKVELLTHYGREHYCPLTILRVYGTTVVEDYEDSEHTETTTSEDQNGDGEPDVMAAQEPQNLFSSATDTVLSLVKTVISPGEAGKEGRLQDIVSFDDWSQKGLTEQGGQDNTKYMQDKMDSVVKMNATARNYSAVNDTVPPVDESQTQPCTPTAHTVGINGLDEPAVERPAQPETPDNKVLDSSSVRQGGEEKDVPVVAVVDHMPLEDKQPLVTLIETQPLVTTLQSLVNRCQFCMEGQPRACISPRRTLCGYYKLMKFVYPTSCINANRFDAKLRPEKPVSVPKSLEVQQPKPVPPSQTVTEPTSSSASDASSVEPRETTPQQVVPSSSTQDRYQRSRAAVEDLPAGDASSSAEGEIQIKPSYEVTSGSMDATHTPETELSHSNAESSTVVGYTEPPVMPASMTAPMTPPTLSCDMPGCQSECSSGEAGSSCTMGPDVAQIRPTSTEEAMETAHQQVLLPDNQKLPDVQEPPSEPPQKPVGSTPPGGADQNGMKNIYAEAPSQGDIDFDLDLIPAALDDQEPVQKLSSGRKETAFMRLKNRIKGLELNLNLSSRYLEELSQRYRRQMEQMYLSLNKTIQKLSNTSRTAEQRDIRQQVNISELTKRIKFLDDQVKSLTDGLADVHSQVIERHLFLMMIEGIIFLLIVTWLLNRRPLQVAGGTPETLTSSIAATRKGDGARQIKAQNKAPDKMKKPSNQTQRRRNSIDTTPTRPRASVVLSQRRSKDDIGLRLSGSESGLNIVTAPVPIAGSSNELKDFTKKKKKKKQGKASLWTSQSSTQMLNLKHGRQLASSTSNSKIHSNAGIIFSTKSEPQEAPSNCCSSGSGSSGSCDSSVSETSVSYEKRQRKNIGPRRSLDLRDLQKQSHLVNGNKHKRQGSHGSLTSCSNAKSAVTDIGRTDIHVINSTANGKAGHTQSRPPDQSGGWKYWFPGVQKL